jgi:amino acid transporter
LSGEFVGFFGGANILMEYVLSNAAVARSFTDYLASTFGVTEHNAWRIIVDGYNALDVPAVALILLITVCLCYR